MFFFRFEFLNFGIWNFYLLLLPNKPNYSCQKQFYL